MRVLLLSVTAGQGHHQCAMALMDYLKERGVDCDLVDTLNYINPIIGESVSQGYLLSTHYSPGAYGKAYRLAEMRRPSGRVSLSHAATIVLAKKIAKCLEDYRPDVVVCTHVFAAQIVSGMSGVSAKTVGIVTDFTIHPYWEETDLDYYVIASERLIHQAVQKWIPQERIRPFGIPISPKFASKLDKGEARRQLGIRDDLATVFLMSGSMGYGNLAKQIKRLDRLPMDFQILSVCGRNEKVKRSIDRMFTEKPIYNYGYVNNVDVMMDAADVMVTKPGGLTVSEGLAKGIPMVLMNPIPGQEERNAEFLLNSGAAMMMSATYPVDECLYQMLSGDDRLAQMEQAIGSIAKPHAARNLGDFLIELMHS